MISHNANKTADDIANLSRFIIKQLSDGVRKEDVIHELVRDGRPKHWSEEAVEAGIQICNGRRVEPTIDVSGGPVGVAPDLESGLCQRLESLVHSLEAARTSLANGASQDEVATQLVGKGLEKRLARGLVNDATIELEAALKEYEKTPEGRLDKADAYRCSLVIGVLWVCGGIAATLATKAVAPGGYFLVFWGAVLFGSFDIVKGLIGWMWYSRTPQTSVPLESGVVGLGKAQRANDSEDLKNARLEHQAVVPSQATVNPIVDRAFSGGSKACLVLQTGPRRGETIPLCDSKVSIGRAPDNNVVVGDPKVSRHHARISYNGGSYFAEDMGSSNGIAVNGAKVSKAILQPGAIIAIGDTRVLFRSSETN